MIIQHIKSNHNLSFKRVSSRPVFIDVDHIQRLKLLFTVVFSNLVDNSQILVNIDETSFLRTTKINYSWSLKGEIWSVSNISFKESVYLICAITSIGDLYALFLTNKNNSSSFIKFIGKMMVWLWVDLNIDLNRIVLMLDNWSIHRSKKLRSPSIVLGDQLYFYLSILLNFDLSSYFSMF